MFIFWNLGAANANWIQYVPWKLTWNPKSWRFGSDDFPFQSGNFSGSSSSFSRGCFPPPPGLCFFFRAYLSVHLHHLHHGIEYSIMKASSFQKMIQVVLASKKFGVLYRQYVGFLRVVAAVICSHSIFGLFIHSLKHRSTCIHHHHHHHHLHLHLHLHHHTSYIHTYIHHTYIHHTSYIHHTYSINSINTIISYIPIYTKPHATTGSRPFFLPPLQQGYGVFYIQQAVQLNSCTKRAFVCQRISKRGFQTAIPFGMCGY